MPTEQYTHYMQRRIAEQERIAQKFPYKPVQQPKQSFWMHSIDRHKIPNEGRITAIVIACAVILFVGIIYLVTK